MFELKFYALLYTDRSPSRVLDEINLEKNTWDMVLFTNWHGNLDSWYNRFEDVVNENRKEEFEEYRYGVIAVNKEGKLYSLSTSKSERVLRNYLTIDEFSNE